MDNMKILLVIDMQNDFVSGTLPTPGAAKIIPKIKKKIEEYIDKDAYDHYQRRVIFTRDTHQGDYLKTNEGINLPVIHCLDETPGWCIVDELYPYYSWNTIVNKDRFGFQKWKDFFDHREWDPIEIEICGLVSNICVVSNALILKSLYPDAKISVLADLCAGTTPEDHEAAMKVMESCQIEIVRE